MSNRVKFTVKCEMEEQWVDSFLSFLMSMQIGSMLHETGFLSFYLDGGKEFKPTFDFGNLDFDFTYKSSTPVYRYNRSGKGPWLIPCWGENIVIPGTKEDENA